jgi:hypothetical protein
LNQKIGNRPDYGAFIPKQLDDYGLNPFEFRVFCHISRRAGTQEGEFFESDLKASKLCRMELKTYRKAKHFLEQAGMITIENRPGKTGVVHLMHHDNWVSGEPLTATKSGGTKSGTATKSGGTKSGTATKSGGTKSGTATKSGGTKSGTTPLPNQVQPNQAHKGTPILSEGIPLKGLKDPLYPPEGDGGIANAFQSEEPIAHEPDEPEQNTTSINNSNPVKGQSSASRRRSPSKAVEGIKRQYRDKLPDWRTGYGVGDYCIGFKFFFQIEVIDKLPESSIWKTYTPAQLIEENEAKGNFAGLEERCKQWQAFEARRQAEAEARAIAAQPPPQVPLIDKPAEIDRIMIIQGLTPADVLGGMRSHPDYRYSMAKVHRDPEVAWAELANGTLSLVHSYLAKLETDAATPNPTP